MTPADLRTRIAIARDQAAGRDSPGYVVLTVDEAESLARQIESADRAAADVSEALNRGDGAYRP